MQKHMERYKELRTAGVRPLPFHTFYGEKWEARNAAGKVTWHTNLTDALMHSESVNQLDDLSSAARQYWHAAVEALDAHVLAWQVAAYGRGF